MQKYIDAGKAFIRRSFCASNSLTIRAITKKNLPYFIGWIAIFIWLYCYLLPMGEFRFQSKWYYDKVGNPIVYFYIWLISGGMIPFLFRVKQFVPKTICSVCITLLGFWSITFTDSSIISKIMMTITAICIGHIFASCIYGFFMILNNSEKFYSMILAVLLPKILMFIKPFLNITAYKMDASVIIIILIIHILLVCSYFFRSYNNDIPVISNTKTPITAYSLMPLLFVVLILNDIIAPVTLSQMGGALSKRQVEIFYFLGILFGILVIIFIQKKFLIHVCNMLNISLALLAVGLTINLAGFPYGYTQVFITILFGCSYSIGLVNIYYLSGLMSKKLQSVRFYKIGIWLPTLYYIIGFAFQLTLRESIPLASSILMTIVSICIILLVFVMSPLFIKMLYSGEWIDDIYRFDVTTCSRLEAYLMEYKLTPSEISVCKLLLNGYTLRQISAMQSKAYATINTYCTSIYRKLDINSRTELLIFLQDYKK